MVGLSQAPSARWLALALDAGQVATVGAVATVAVATVGQWRARQGAAMAAGLTELLAQAPVRRHGRPLPAASLAA